MTKLFYYINTYDESRKCAVHFNVLRDVEEEIQDVVNYYVENDKLNDYNFGIYKYSCLKAEVADILRQQYSGNQRFQTLVIKGYDYKIVDLYDQIQSNLDIIVKDVLAQLEVNWEGSVKNALFPKYYVMGFDEFGTPSQVNIFTLQGAKDKILESAKVYLNGSKSEEDFDNLCREIYWAVKDLSYCTEDSTVLMGDGKLNPVEIADAMFEFQNVYAVDFGTQVEANTSTIARSVISYLENEKAC